MGRQLVLAEKPSVGRELARVLGCRRGGEGYLEGDRYVVTWALGHLVTLADPDVYEKKWEKWDMADLPMLPQHRKLVVIPQTARQFRVVQSLMKRSDITGLIIATDAGREGELVARWIMAKAGWNKPAKRLWISSQTDKAIRDGFADLRPAADYENLFRSAQARSEADWLVGLNVTRALTCKYNAQLSAGRVQTPTLALIAARERETVSALGHALGGDEESVCAALTLAASELSRLEEELRQRERETGRITAALCLGGGAMLCILLL